MQLTTDAAQNARHAATRKAWWITDGSDLMELGLTLQRAMTGHGSGRLDGRGETLAGKPPLLVTCGAPQIRVGKTDFPDGEPARAGEV